MSGFNFEMIKSKFGNAITQQAFDQLDILDGKKDNEIDNSVFEKIQEVTALYNGFRNKSEFSIWIENSDDETTKQVADILVKSFESAKDVSANEPTDTDTSIKHKKTTKKDNSEPSAVQRMQEIAEEMLRQADELAKNDDDAFTSEMTIDNFPLGVEIISKSVNIHYDKPKSDRWIGSLLGTREKVERDPDGIELILKFKYDGKTYTAKAFSDSPALLKQIREDYTLEGERKVSAKINGIEEEDNNI